MTATSIRGRRVIAAFIPLASGLLLALLAALSAATAPIAAQSSILYVDAAATGAADGSSWDDAYTSLQDALAAAQNGNEIWVATGVYTPGTSVEDSFSVPSGVALYGGFAGNETSRDQRDWVANPTVLSGDVDGNDEVDGRGVVTETAGIQGANADHVLVLDGTSTPITSSTRLDGVIITAGQAKGSYPDSQGGGLFCNGSRATDSECSPTLTNVTFAGNTAELRGGAMANDGDIGISSPTLTNVTFTGNSASEGGTGGDGGAMYNNGRDGISSPILTNVTFSNNWADVNGGAMVNYGVTGISNPVLTNVTFTGNSARLHGGAVFNDGSSGESNPMLTNVTFAGNSANNGGAMYNIVIFGGDSNPTLTNVLFAGNSADTGGAMYNFVLNTGSSSPTLTNVTFAGNSADSNGGAIADIGNVGQSGPTLNNVILWDNSAGTSGDVIYNLGGAASATIADSLVQGGWNGSGIANEDGGSVTDGGGNIDADPLFVSPVDPDDAPTTTGDLRLQLGSAAIDAGDDGALPAGVTIDLAGNPRLQDGDNDGAPAVDMGAYEFISPLISVGLAPVSVAEDSGEVITVTFTRSQNTLGVITATFDIAGSATFNTDYGQSGATSFDGSNGSVTFDDGVVTRTMSIIPIPDFVVEPDETVAITLSASTSYSVSVPSAVTGTIIDVNSAGVAVEPTSGLTTSEAGGTDTFTVRLQSKPVGTVTVTLSSDDPTEGTVAPATLTFDATNWQTPQTATVTGVDDNADDGDIAYTIEPTISSDDSDYDGIEVDDVNVTNLDDDGAGVTVTASSNLTTTESGDTATFDVVLQSEPAGTVTVTLSSDDPTEGTVSPAALSFDNTNWNVAQTVTATGVDDEVDDGHVAYTIETTVTSNDPDYDGIETTDVHLVNLNDDHYLFIPLTFSRPPGLPDLLVEELVVSSDGVTVVIANAGESAVVDPFWVDVYIDPDPAPTAVNQTWPLLAGEGLVWGITGQALPLLPGEHLTLTIGGAYYAPDESHFSSTIAAGTPLYAQVDSAHSDTDYGAVLEAHEESGASYNNIAGPVVPTVTVTPELTTPVVINKGQIQRNLPRRPSSLP